MVNLGDKFPNFKAKTTIGDIQFHDWLGNKWGLLFSHPADFTPVCTTELGRVAKLVPEFQKRGVQVIALSCDSVESHSGWIEDIKVFARHGGEGFPYPIIADENRELAVQLGMLDPAEKDKDGLPLTCRAVFLIDPNKRLRLSILYPATTGRNFDEILRAVDSVQLTEKHKVATPADWKVTKQRSGGIPDSHPPMQLPTQTLSTPTEIDTSHNTFPETATFPTTPPITPSTSSQFQPFSFIPQPVLDDTTPTASPPPLQTSNRKRKRPVSHHSPGDQYEERLAKAAEERAAALTSMAETFKETAQFFCETLREVKTEYLNYLRRQT